MIEVRRSGGHFGIVHSDESRENYAETEAFINQVEDILITNR